MIWYHLVTNIYSFKEFGNRQLIVKMKGFSSIITCFWKYVSVYGYEISQTKLFLKIRGFRFVKHKYTSAEAEYKNAWEYMK